MTKSTRVVRRVMGETGPLSIMGILVVKTIEAKLAMSRDNQSSSGWIRRETSLLISSTRALARMRYKSSLFTTCFIIFAWYLHILPNGIISTFAGCTP